MVKIEIKKSELKVSGKKFLEIETECILDNGLYKLTGSNGSGKTLFLEYLSGIRKTENIVLEANSKKILYLGEVGIGMEDLTIFENIKLVYWIFGTKLDEKIIEKIKTLYSDEQLNKIYSQSSFGMQLMVGLSLLFSDIDWELIILDETLSGIDINNRQILINELMKKKHTATIFIVSHEQLDEKINYKEVHINDKKLFFKQ